MLDLGQVQSMRTYRDIPGYSKISMDVGSGTSTEYEDTLGYPWNPKDILDLGQIHVATEYNNYTVYEDILGYPETS